MQMKWIAVLIIGMMIIIGMLSIGVIQFVSEKNKELMANPPDTQTVPVPTILAQSGTLKPAISPSTSPTKVPTTTVTTKAPIIPAGPALDSTKKFTMGSNEIAWFTAKNKGNVRFDISHSSVSKDPDCTDKGRLTLAGPGYDKTLSAGRVILSLPHEGSYSLTTSGCTGWVVSIQNA